MRGLVKIQTYSAFLSMCALRKVIWAARSKFHVLSGSSSGNSGVPRCFIHTSYHLSSSRFRYASAPGWSRNNTIRCRAVFRGIARNTCSKAAQSGRLLSRERALIMADASRASSSKSFVHAKRCRRRMIFPSAPEADMRL